MHWIKLRNANCFRFCVGSLAAQWIITKARAITSAFMGTYIRGFLCRGFQTPSRSDWTGPADCSSETEAAWSPGEGGKKESIKKTWKYEGLSKEAVLVTWPPYWRASAHLFWRINWIISNLISLTRANKLLPLDVFSGRKISLPWIESTLCHFLTWIIEHASGLTVKHDKKCFRHLLALPKNKAL